MKTATLRKSLLLSFIFIFSIALRAQMSGTYTVPGSFPSLAVAISSLNSVGVSGGVTVYVQAAYTETVPVTGLMLTTSGTAFNPIVFQKLGTGANPLLYAYTGGTATPSSAVQDGIWSLIGCDYITIDGIDLLDPNTSNPATMEYGYGLFKASTTDGCSFNTIKNCAITLNRINVANGAGTAMAGSRGIDLVNATAAAHTTSLNLIAFSGISSNNTFHNNRISNTNIGITLIGFADVSPFTYADVNNDVGGVSAVTGNTIVNFGGGTGTVNAAVGIKTSSQYNLNISHNTVNSNDGGGVNHIYDMYGMLIQAATSADVSVTGNTITLKGGGSARQLVAIANQAGSTATSNSVTISNNLIAGCSYSSINTGSVYGINNSGSPAYLVITNNTFTNCTSAASDGVISTIYNLCASPDVLISGNSIGSISLTTGFSTGVRLTGILNGGGVSGGSVSISSNSMQSLSFANPSAHDLAFINSQVSNFTGFVSITDNSINNINISSSRMMNIYTDNSNTGNVYFGGNTVKSFTNTLSNGQLILFNSNVGSQPGAMTIHGNNFSDVVATGATQVFGLYYSHNYTQSLSITSNTLDGVSTASHISCFFFNNYLNSNISNNLIKNINVGTYIRALSLFNNTGTFHTISGNTLTALTASLGSITGIDGSQGYTVNVLKNHLSDFTSYGSSGSVHGITVAGGTVINVHNNIIGNLNAPVNSMTNGVIGINATIGSTLNLFYNTIRLAASSTGSVFGSSALSTNTTLVLNMRNNILINVSTANGTGLTVAYRRNGASLTSYSTTSNTNLFYAGVPSPSNMIYSNGTTTYPTLISFQSAVSPRESASFVENTAFQSLTGNNAGFLHINTPSLAESNAVNVAAITDDVDGDVRQGNTGYTGTGTAPDIGADEFDSPPCSSVTMPPPAISTSALNGCVGQTITLVALQYPKITGSQPQWQVSTLSGSNYSTIATATAQTYTTTISSPGTYYFVMTRGCSNSTQVAVSSEATVTVYGLPMVAVSSPTSTFCLASTPVELVASGANTYSWLPSSGLNTTIGTTVNASPSSQTTYTVIGTGAGGCTSTATALVKAVQGVTSLTVGSSASLICQGSTVNLQAGGTTSVYSITPISFAPVSTPTSGAGIALYCNNGVINSSMSSGNLNDGRWSGQGITFNFGLYNTFYNAYSLSTNGFIQLTNSFPPYVITGFGIPFPNTTSALPAIGAVYADLDFSNGGYIFSTITGSSPNRKLLVNWVNGRFYNGSTGTGTVTTQLILFESSNFIEVHTSICSGQLPAVEGIQNSSGTEAAVVNGRNAQTYTVMNSANRWHFPLTYTWTPSLNLSATNASVTTASNIQNTTTYTVEGIAANGCGLKATRTISVIPSPTLVVTGGTVPQCPGAAVTLSVTGANTYTWSTSSNLSTVTVNPNSTTTYTVSGTATTNSCVTLATHVVSVNPNPVLSFSGPASVCHNQPVLLTAFGANTYSWNTGATTATIAPSSSVTGNYTFQVAGTSTAGCTSTASTALIVHIQPTVAITGNTLVCSGQPVMLTASGANSYNWSNGSTGPSITQTLQYTASFTVTGTLNPGSCSAKAYITLSVVPSPTVSVSGDFTVCAGDSLLLTADGADTYVWSTGNNTHTVIVAPATTTVYQVTGYNNLNNCQHSIGYGVQVKPPPILVIAGSTSICPGTVASFTAAGADVFTWLPSNHVGTVYSISPTAPTSITLWGQATNGCYASMTLPLHIFPQSTLVVTPLQQTVCAGETATFSASGSHNYVWTPVSYTTSLINVSPVTSTNYTLFTTDINNCRDTAQAFLNVDACIGLADNQANDRWSIFPNPSLGVFNLEFSGQDKKTVEVYNMMMQSIYKVESAEETLMLDLNSFANGMYLVRVTTGNMRVEKKVIKN